MGWRSSWVVLIAALLGAGWWYYRNGQQTGAPTPATAAVTRGTVVETVEATGKLRAVTTVQVGTQVSGTIKLLKADFNSRVRRGQVVAELDPSLFEAQVEQARAAVLRVQAETDRGRVQLDDALMKLSRARQLSQKALLAATDLEAAEVAARQAEASLKSLEAQVVQAEASLNQSRVNLGHTVIRAPIDGVVVSRNVDVGQTVAASMQAPTLFVIARDLAEMQVNASVSEADIGRIQPGQPATFRVDAYPSRVFAGTVSQVRLEPVVEQNVVSYMTVIDVANPELALKPGMTANVTVEVARADDVLRVPVAALRVRPSADVLAAFGAPEAPTSSAPVRAGQRASASPGKTNPHPGDDRGHVWVVTGGRLQSVAVTVGINDGVNAAVMSDELQEGALVVTNIAGAAATGSVVRPSSPLLPTGRGRGPGGGGGPR